MAATRKSSKRSAGKKRLTATKKGSTKKSAKSARTKTKKAGRGTTTGLRRRARKGLTAARDGFDSVLEAGGKTWRTLKNTTAHMVEGVKESLASDAEGETRGRRRR
jgi:hypothetical protein